MSKNWSLKCCTIGYYSNLKDSCTFTFLNLSFGRLCNRTISFMEFVHMESTISLYLSPSCPFTQRKHTELSVFTRSLYLIIKSLFFFGFQIPEKTLIAYLLSEYTVRSEPSGTEQTALMIASISIRLLVV